MNTNDFQMIVAKVVVAPARGVVASGIIGAGGVRTGDVVQVPPGSLNQEPTHLTRNPITARVALITKGRSIVKDAKTGHEVMLLLEFLNEHDVRVGDR